MRILRPKMLLLEFDPKRHRFRRTKLSRMIAEKLNGLPPHFWFLGIGVNTGSEKED